SCLFHDCRYPCGEARRYDMKPTIPPAPRTLDATDEPGHSLVVCAHGRIVAYPLRIGAAYTIGRASANDIVIPNDSVSRRHAIVHGGRTPELEDLRSRNGTTLDGKALAPGSRAALTVGAAIRIGPATLFVHTGQLAAESIGPLGEDAVHSRGTSAGGIE